MKILLLMFTILMVNTNMKAQTKIYKTLTDTVMNTPNGTLKITIRYFNDENIYKCYMKEINKPLRLNVPFEGEGMNIWNVSHSYILPLFKETYPLIYQLFETDKLTKGYLGIVCDSNKLADKEYLLELHSKNINYLYECMNEITRDGRLLILLQKSVDYIYPYLPQPKQGLINEYKRLYKDEKQIYKWIFIIQLKKDKFKQFCKSETEIK